jgi:hypothetical protein
MKALLKKVVQGGLRMARRSPRLRCLLDEDAMAHMTLDPSLYENKNWQALDPVFRLCRRKLYADAD